GLKADEIRFVRRQIKALIHVAGNGDEEGVDRNLAQDGREKDAAIDAVGLRVCDRLIEEPDELAVNDVGSARRGRGGAILNPTLLERGPNGEDLPGHFRRIAALITKERVDRLRRERFLQNLVEHRMV